MDFLYDLRGNIIFDMDEILVNIFPTVYAYYVNNTQTKFKEFLQPRKLTEFDMDIINQRRHHDVRIELLRPEFSSLPENKQMEVLKRMRTTKADRDYWKTDIYRNLEPTQLGKMLMYSSVIDRPEIKTVTILTFSSSNELNQNKQAFVNKYFNHSKIKLVPVNGFGKNGSRIKKSDVMKKTGIDWDVFFDDMKYNIMDFAENYQSIKDKIFFMPKFGYNKLSEEEIKYITDRGGVIQYYVP